MKGDKRPVHDEGPLAGLRDIARGVSALFSQPDVEQSVQSMKDDAAAYLEDLPGAPAHPTGLVSSYRGYANKNARPRRPGWDFSGW